MIIVAVAALIGGRAYHVIDQWALYKDDLLKIVLPPYTGLGVYGGIITGTIAVIAYARYHRQPFWVWADVIAPGLFAMQVVARWGNFFNQELYGPPTTAPWGIAIDCAHRVVGYLCPPDGTTPATAHFQPLFLYESLSGLVGMLTLLWLSQRFAARLRTGEIALIFLIWYAAVRFVLEFLRVDNWTFFGIPVAQLVSVTVIVVALGLLVRRHAPDPAGAAPAGRAGTGRTGAGRRSRREGGGRARSRGQPEHDARATAPASAGPHLARGARPSAGRCPGGPRLARPGPRDPGLASWSAAWRSSSGSSSSACSGSASSGSAREPCRDGRLPPRRRPSTGAGWTRSSSCTRCRSSRGSGSSAARRRRSARAGGSALLHRVGGLLPVWRGGVGIDQHVASARAVLAAGGVFVLMPEGSVAGPPDRIAPFRIGSALIALRTGAPIVPFAIAGSAASCTSAAAWPRGSCPDDPAAALLGPDWGGRCPPAADAEPSSDARPTRLTAALRRRSSGRHVVEAAIPEDDRPAAGVASHRLRSASTWAVPRPGVSAADADGLSGRSRPVSSPRWSTPTRSSTSWATRRWSGSSRVTRDLGPAGAPAAHPGQARDAQPGRLGQGPHRPADDRGRRARRPAQAGRHDHRADQRQHRPRPGDRRRPQGLSLHLRHGRQAVGGEAGAAAGLRRGGRAVPDQRRARIARELLLGRRAPGARHPGRVQARPVLEQGEPGRPRAHDRPRDLAPDRGPDHAPRGQRRDRRHDHRRRPLPQGAEPVDRRSSAPIPRAASCPATSRGRT